MKNPFGGLLGIEYLPCTLSDKKHLINNVLEIWNITHENFLITSWCLNLIFRYFWVCSIVVLLADTLLMLNYSDYYYYYSLFAVRVSGIRNVLNAHIFTYLCIEYLHIKIFIWSFKNRIHHVLYMIRNIINNVGWISSFIYRC